MKPERLRRFEISIACSPSVPSTTGTLYVFPSGSNFASLLMCGSCCWFKRCRAVCEEEKFLARRETVKPAILIMDRLGRRVRAPGPHEGGFPGNCRPGARRVPSPGGDGSGHNENC